MVFNAHNQNIPVNVIPVSINQYKAHKFRSKVIIEFGREIQPNKKLMNE